ncbi:hypothetical protein NUW58_g4083 [Xylaria curta]|uniref:Uncharacterized protein n=1 Tax=Xylaria curta TaxID=42375 RepID=A0ACC1P8X2_9PEZI|nr:hypothetical protein NUW58_g4083 [Xylaria curta]
MGFTVVIVGGSVAGLTLANLFEKFEINYVLLEAYDNIAPQLGASIGLPPTGLRILDQLGCYEAFRSQAGGCDYQSSIRGFDGRIVDEKKSVTFSKQLEHKTGYPQLFIDRQTLLQVLFNNLKFKDRVLTRKRVTRVVTVEGLVHVETQDGSTYTGDIVVGADGIHSAVRKEMWRNAHEAGSALFHPDEESKLQAESKCIFGISRRPIGLPTTDIQISAFYNGCTYVMFSGAGDRLYWFLISKMEKAFGKDIPRFTKEDEAHLAAQHLDDYVTDTVTFGDIYKVRITSTLVALQEHVFARWHFQRIIVIGDAAHKFHPITAQGGNSAMVTAVVLANLLRRKLGGSANAALSEDEVENIFAEVQTKRFNSVMAYVHQGRLAASYSTTDTLLSRIGAHYVFPWFGDRILLTLIVKAAKNSPLIENIAVPERYRRAVSRTAGFSRTSKVLWISGAFVAGLALFLYLS